MKGTREALVGLVIVAALVVTVVGTLWLQGFQWGQDQQELEAVFFEVGLVRAGNAVKFRGVQVGRVREITVDPDGEVVRIRFRIDEDLALPQDPVVILSPESMFGDWQAEIHSRDRYPFANYTEPTESGVLPGHALPDISQLTHMADRISENLAVLTDRIGIAFSDETASNVASLIENVEDVTERLSQLVSQQATSFAEVTDGIQRTTEGIGSAAEQARSAFLQVDQLLTREDLSETLENLATISSNLREVSGELEGTNAEVREMAARVDSTFSRAQALLSQAEAGEGTLGRLLQDPTMANEMEGMVAELRLLLEDIRENPRRYVRLSIF